MLFGTVFEMDFRDQDKTPAGVLTSIAPGLNPGSKTEKEKFSPLSKPSPKMSIENWAFILPKAEALILWPLQSSDHFLVV
ncbi:MAG: hypothetical protein CL666_01590 [Balneola sp.]|nr:hypothetical protein [Balneola sp.]|tara:strand:- start:69024 stop:69263 length:240 start_codon:yes stop_codon:yes gene_type:complete